MNESRTGSGAPMGPREAARHAASRPGRLVLGAATCAVFALQGCGGGSGFERRRVEAFSIDALDGWVRSDGEFETDGGGPGVGDLQDNKEVRMFLSFSLEDLPSDARIEEATLRVGFTTRVGAPEGLQPLILERIDLGTELDAVDFSSLAKSAPTNLLINGNLGTRDVDVTTLVQQDLDEGRTRHDLRLRLAGGTDGDGLSDFLGIETGGNDWLTGDRPRLQIYYERDAP